MLRDITIAAACPSVLVMGSARPEWPCFIIFCVAFLNCQITELYNELVESIRDSNKWDLVRPAFTCDLWRSRTRREYFTLTMHYIDVKRGEAGTRWLLRKRILGSVAVQATNIDHEGDKDGNWAAVCGRLGMLCSVFIWL